MHCTRLLHKLIKNSCPNINKKRLDSLFICVDSILSGGNLAVASIGRNIKTNTNEKHAIKRADRLVGNKKLHAEIGSIYNALSSKLIGNTKKPIILIDWSIIGSDRKQNILRATIPLEGRGFTLYEEVHPEEKQYNPKIESKFLETIKSMLPKEVKPIIITDAGFRIPWFKKVTSLGWDYVGRVRSRAHIKIDTKWETCKQLHEKATNTPEFFENSIVGKKSSSITSNIVLYKKRNKGRRNNNRYGNKYKATAKLKLAKREKEPWILVTSLSKKISIAKKVVKYYRLRMKIEESFRDLKSHRFGFGLNNTGTKTKERLEVLLLISNIAVLVAWLIGKIVVSYGRHYAYQANTTKTRRVLSTFFIGCRAIKKPDKEKIRLKDLLLSFNLLVNDIKEFHHEF